MTGHRPRRPRSRDRLPGYRDPLPALSPDQVAAIFLGQAGRFPDGAEAVALDQRLGSSERNVFYSQVTGKTPALAARARDRAWAERGADLRAKLRGIEIMQGKRK